MQNRTISTQLQEEDIKIESNLRPQTLDDYIGQEKAKENLRIYIEAAKRRGESLDHVLLYGHVKTFAIGKRNVALLLFDYLFVDVILNYLVIYIHIKPFDAITSPLS